MLNNKIFIITFLLVISIIYFNICDNVIKNISPTYDEPLHLFQGYSYLKTGSLQTVSPYDHPMISKLVASMGLLFLTPTPTVFVNHPTWENKQRYSFANLMLYYNNVDAEKMLNTSRRIIVVCSIIFLIIYFFIIKKTFNTKAAIFGVLLYVFNNIIISNATLVTQDFLYSVFYFISLYYFYLWLEKKSFRNNILTNIFFAITICTKFSALILWLSFVLFIFWGLYKNKLKYKEVLNFFVLNILSLLVIVLIVYRIEYFTTFFKSFFVTIKNLQEGRSTFFLGKHSTQGFRQYFLTLFMLKTEIPLLIFLFVKTVLDFFVKKDDKRNFHEIFLLFNIIIYFTIASFSKTQIGIRHLLPIYFIIIYFVSNLVSKKQLLPLIITLTLWYIISFIRINPWHISYFNELCGGPQNGFKYFTDSNIDWGQGLKHLGKWAEKNLDVSNNGIYFSYFGVGDPKYYGIKYKPIGFVTNLVLNERVGDDILVNKPKKIYFVISATNLQSTYYKDKKVFDFLKKYFPDKVVAYSLFVYEITKDNNIKNDFIKLLESINYNEDANYLKMLS